MTLVRKSVKRDLVHAAAKKIGMRIQDAANLYDALEDEVYNQIVENTDKDTSVELKIFNCMTVKSEFVPEHEAVAGGIFKGHIVPDKIYVTGKVSKQYEKNVSEAVLG